MELLSDNDVNKSEYS